MKKIILIGDSIRMGYDKYVAMALEGVPEHFFSDKTHYYTQAATEVITGQVLNVIGGPFRCSLNSWITTVCLALPTRILACEKRSPQGCVFAWKEATDKTLRISNFSGCPIA